MHNFRPLWTLYNTIYSMVLPRSWAKCLTVRRINHSCTVFNFVHFDWNISHHVVKSFCSWLGIQIMVSYGTRSGKNTHISRISNSVTHLRSYTNTGIFDIVTNSTPGADHATPSANITVPNADVAADIVASNGECFMMFYKWFTMFYMFHNVLQVFHDVLWVFHHV